MEVNVSEARKRFSNLIKRAIAGEEAIITRSGVPRARLVAVEVKVKRPLGFARGEVWVADDFDAPLPDYLLKQFYGGELPPLEPLKHSRKKK